jgi:site-specific recombinase XerD
MPKNAYKDVYSRRIRKFTTWLDDTGRQWTSPDLATYRDELLERYVPSTVSAHLSTIRAQYSRLLMDNATRDLLFDVAATQTDNAVERKVIVDEIVTRLSNEMNPKSFTVKLITRQDVADSAPLRLTREQAEALLMAPGVDTRQGLRDTAIIALMLCTGIREAELSALDVKDLRQELGGKLALHVRKGKDTKARLVPYGELDFCLAIVDKWLANAGIQSGPVFKEFYKGAKKMRRGRLFVRAIEYILFDYPITITGKVTHVKPHDCRRTYARRLYEAGADLIAIQQNLGHADTLTTLGYIGTLGAKKRRAPDVYSFDLRALNGSPS